MLLSSAFAGCPGEDPDALDPLEIPEGCQPLLAGKDCMLPYPSDAFLVDDSTRPTGKRIEMPESAKLYTDDGYSADVNDVRKSDGYSTTQPIVFLLAEPVVDEGLIGIFDDPTSSQDASNKTVVLDVARGTFVPHFVDIDPRAVDDERRGVIIRPLVALAPESRFVVAVQGVQNTSGENAAVPEGFRRLRDKVTSQDASLDAIAARYESDVFAPLIAAGVSRDTLQLAWDFSTGSEEHMIGDMLTVREKALAALDATPPAVAIVSVFDDDDGSWRVVRGTIEVPFFSVSEQPGSDLFRDAAGVPTQNGTALVPFTAVVPYSVMDSYEPGKALLFGHGFFGSRFELETTATRKMCDELGAVGFAVDWWGMNESDVGFVLSAMASDVSTGVVFGERVPQAMVNFITLTRAIKNGSLAATDAFKRPTDAGAPGVVVNPANAAENNAGEPVFDGEHVHYLGISMGHILGGMHAALNPDVERVMLHAGGASFTEMMFRANPFKRFLFILDFQVPDALDTQKLASSMQLHFDRFDPARYAPYVLSQELPIGRTSNRENKQVLISYGVGDTQVPNFASVLHGRLLGIPHMTPAPRTPLLMDTVTDDGAVRSAVSAFDFGVDDGFYAVANPPELPNAVHNDARVTPVVLEQMKAFLHTGVVVHPCEGPCVTTLDPID